VQHQGREHPRQADILGEDGAAIDLAGAVLAANRRIADQPELCRVLELDLSRDGLPGRDLR
jgi:hypothetical protein